jgi:uncharacterized protein Yka (UPF0111/DUF47 family)
MTTMAEIEKAVDEFEKASRLMESAHWQKIPISDEGFSERCRVVNEAKHNLMQLIDGLAQYQPREVSNE